MTLSTKDWCQYATVERDFHSLSELIEAIAAARTFGLRFVSVSTEFHESFTADNGTRLEARWEYHAKFEERAS